MTPRPRSQDEIQLVAHAKNGDHDAFRELYELNVDFLYRFMMQFSANHDQVKDWVQRAFIKAYEGLPAFDGISLFSTWLFKLALNEMRMDFRRAKIIPFVPTQSDNEELSVQQDDGTFEWSQTMKQWLGELSELKRGVFILYEVEGYSHAEIAQMLQIGESTSRTTLSRVKRFLQERWEQERKAI